MNRIYLHPILDVSESEKHSFYFDEKLIEGEKGKTIAAALHQAGLPVHSHSLDNRERSLECGIGKCGACEMLVDGEIRRICITKVDGVKNVSEIDKNFIPETSVISQTQHIKVFRTKVAIIGAGPAGLAVREELNKRNIDSLIIDNNDHIGGQFLMQTHQFFFFEKEKKFGGMRGFEIANMLAGNVSDDFFLNCTVWDILNNNRLAIKNISTGEIFYIEADFLVVATGAVPFMPTFRNDDLPGVYTAAVVQKMMNTEFTLLGKNILTVGAGNIGFLTSYQLMQAGANVKAIIEAAPQEGGFPVQANRIKRLGVPIMLSKILVEAIPNASHTGIIGAVIADCKDFQPIAGTEQIMWGIDTINICTGLVPDDQLLIKGYQVFGRRCFGAGDAIRIGEGTSAVLKGKQIAYEIALEMNTKVNYNEYLQVSKEYIDSQQHPIRIAEEPATPSEIRKQAKPYVIIDCLYGFACNPCEFACTYGAIRKTSTSTIPSIDYDKCIGCLDCVYQCPGLAIFGYHNAKNWVFVPVEMNVQEHTEVFLVNNAGNKIGEGVIEKILRKPNKTNIARVKCLKLYNTEITEVRGFINKDNYPEPIVLENADIEEDSKTYVCHCDDVTVDEILETIGNRKFISVDEIKHTTRLGMGACRGKRCIPRLKQTMRSYQKTIVGEATPRGPLSNQISLGELNTGHLQEETIIHHTKKISKVETQVLIAGGGIGGTALFRYLAEAGMKPTLINFGRGASWRNIAGGRPNFSVPELSEIASQNLHIFKELQAKQNIDFRQTRYVTFAHNEAIYKALEASMAWSEARMISPSDFRKEISPFFNPSKVIDLIRQIGTEYGGKIEEDAKLIDIKKDGKLYKALVQLHNGEYVEYTTPHFINALGPDSEIYARKLGIITGSYAVKHQAFITRRLPLMGIHNEPLHMLIDRNTNKGFSAVYGQQLAETGQIIGCASPAVDAIETNQNLKINTLDFLQIVSEIFSQWIPNLASVGFQATWAGYYIEPRMIIDTDLGLFVGLRGQGFMLGQYLAKMYADKLSGKHVPAYFEQLALSGAGISEKAFK